MKTITLKEFAELAKKDEALKEKIVNCVKPGSEGGIPQDLIDLAAEYGYTLTAENIYSTVREDEELSDEELERIAGGDYLVASKSRFCEIIMGFLGFDTADCFD